MHDRIEANQLNFDKTVDTIRNFVKLFIIDQGAVDTLSKDEWSRKIANAIHWQNIKDRILKGEKVDIKEMEVSEVTEEGLRRLDSVHLNKLTSKAFSKKETP